jgi:hypothetical protein
MFLAEYLSVLTAQVDEDSRTGLITSPEIKADFRTEKMGVIRGIIEFIDESKLFLTEYLDFRYKLEKLTYAYHYQDKNCFQIDRSKPHSLLYSLIHPLSFFKLSDETNHSKL